jgi:DNA-binding MarR family transcriptional regulator
MNNNTIDNIIENFFYVFILVHKKVLKFDPVEINPDFSLSRLHIAVLGIINEESTLPISEIGKKLLVPKPQMSLMINQLVNAGMVERNPNQDDRRISNISLTADGKSTLSRCEADMKNIFRQKLAYLNDQDMEDLSSALQKLREIGMKWEIPINKPEASLPAIKNHEINS